MDTPTETFPSKSYALSGKIMLTSIVILSSVLFLMVLLHLYVRFYLCRRRHHITTTASHRRSNTHIVFYSSGPISPNLSRGLDASVLASLPMLSYDPNTPIPECAVCLSEFEDGEKVRLLPKCGHGFHVRCIDMWFHSHATCPLCRSSVEKFKLSSGSPGRPRAGTSSGLCAISPMMRSPMVKIDVENGVLPGRAEAGYCDTCRAFRSSVDTINAELGLPGQVETGSSSGPCATCCSVSFSGDKMKEWRNGKFRIEVPRRRNELASGSGASSPATQGFWSPATRLKRILSMGIRSAMVSPTNGPSHESTGSDLECGVCESSQDSSKVRVP